VIAFFSCNPFVTKLGQLLHAKSLQKCGQRGGRQLIVQRDRALGGVGISFAVHEE